MTGHEVSGVELAEHKADGPDPDEARERKEDRV